MVTTAAHNAGEMLGCNLFALMSDLNLKERRVCGRKKLYRIFFILNVFHYILKNKTFILQLNLSTVLNSINRCRNVKQNIHIHVLIVNRES